MITIHRSAKLLHIGLVLIVLMFGAGCAPAEEKEANTLRITATPTAENEPIDNSEAPYPVETSEPVVGNSISGTVLSGGDQTPAGLQDAPRTFIYQVQLEDGTQVNVEYTAYPPSPAVEKHKITLEFHAGEIQVGDYLEAQGTYDPATRTLTVAEEGDFIRTFPAKPESAYP